MSTVTLTEADSGGSFVIHPGDDVIIQLPEIATSGYRWAVDRVGGPAVSLERSEYAPPTGPGIGGSGMRTFAIHAQAVGAAQVALKNWREWEGDTSTQERFTVTLQIQP